MYDLNLILRNISKFTIQILILIILEKSNI